MRINKKFLQFVSTVLILAFHYWYRFGNTVFERFIVSISYIGVDLFFICSAYSLSRKKQIEYKSLLINRFTNIYSKFVVFSFIYTMFIYSGKKLVFTDRLIKFVQIVCGIELFNKGGGAFLWFVPAIMLFYILFPLFINWRNRFKSIFVLAVYVALAILFQNISYREIFIVLNRIPLIIFTYELCQISLKKDWLWGVLFTVVGFILMYEFSFRVKLNKPFYDSYYLVAIVLCTGISVLSRYIKSNKVFDMISSASLEIYALQMMYGYRILMNIVKFTKVPLFVNIINFALIIGIGIVVNKLFEFVLKRV